MQPLQNSNHITVNSLLIKVIRFSVMLQSNAAPGQSGFDHTSPPWVKRPVNLMRHHESLYSPCSHSPKIIITILKQAWVQKKMYVSLSH